MPAKIAVQTDVKSTNPFIARELVTYTATGPKTGTAVFKVGLESFPDLADHGFQDMTVIPGAFFIEMAACVHLECLHASLGRMSQVEFLHPVVLSDGDINLTVVVRWLNDDTVGYALYESDGQGLDISSARPSAKLQIGCADRQPSIEPKSDFDVEVFQRHAEDLGEQAGFYRRLRAGGNQYGPRFQSLRHVWRSGREVLGRLGVPAGNSAAGCHQLQPVLMDGVAHLLAAFHLDQGRTFILQSIESIAVHNPAFPAEVWVHGRLRSEEGADANRGIGDLEVFDDAGATYVQLTGTQFTYLEWAGPKEAVGVPKTDIVVASTFTAEPVEDSLQFWGDYLGFPMQVRFAPYNQVFQELLNPESLLRRNQDGYNVILLNLADWEADGRMADLKLEPEKATACFGSLARYVLPNEAEIAHLNRHETEYVFKEIFEDRCYMRHGIQLPADAIVIDIGANIGLFSLFVRSQSPRAKVYAFEPSPIAYQALKANCEAYGPLLHAFNAGVSDRRGAAQLTFYEKSSVFSSFHANEEEDRQAIRAVVANMVRGELGTAAGSTEEDVDDLMIDRLDRQTFDCPLLSVSDIIRENGLPRVDLLKVDAEKCELEILRGIDDCLWSIINQVVVEVHDRSRQALEEVQSILAARGFICAAEEEILLAGSGLFNVYATRPDRGAQARVEQSQTERPSGDVRSKADQFAQALETFSQAAKAPTILCLCPAEGKASPRAARAQELAEIESRLLQRAGELPRVQVIGSEAILARYPTPEFHDPHTADLGHIPYTPDGFAAIGTSLIRTIFNLQRAPYKVIALDCDHTLWQGACGEEGPLGVAVTPGHRRLQEFMIRQTTAGMLLCLCSKNSEADVWAVWDRNPGMVLKREHLAAWRINWVPKSENLRSLAKELGLGPESIIFVDDNPVECAEVRAGCPGVLTLQLPSDPDSWPQFLDHSWAFDHLRITGEDQTRTQKVRENLQRETYRGQVATLKDFIDGLQLQVAIAEPVRDQISRVSQLTYRTNQFNFSTIRRSESDVLRFLEQGNGRGLAVTVRDRFGDYGMVGLLLYQAAGESYRVDTFLLSCRVLGRGVEHQILADLGHRALDQGIPWVELTFRPSEKNQPAWEFISSVGAEFKRQTDDGVAFRFPAASLAALRYEPNRPPSNPGPAQEDGPTKSGSSVGSASAVRLPGLAEKLPRIATDLCDSKQIVAAVEAHRLRASGFDRATDAGDLPQTLEGRLLGLWRTSIGNPRIGPNDNFFDAGGTSLKAVRTVAAIRRELHLPLSVINLFECPTVRLLADKLTSGKAGGASAREAMERGARRIPQPRRRT